MVSNSCKKGEKGADLCHRRLSPVGEEVISRTSKGRARGLDVDISPDVEKYGVRIDAKRTMTYYNGLLASEEKDRVINSNINGSVGVSPCGRS